MKKAVLITGASSGIGAAAAEVFSQKGYFVYLLGRNAENLNKVLQKITQKSAEPSNPSKSGQIIVCDLAQESDVLKVETVLKNMDPKIQIEALVNNAGIFQPHPFEEDNLNHWIGQFQTNLFGAVRITQIFFKYFKALKKGSVVNVSSTLGLRPVPGVSAYCASKAAMVNWTQALALEGAPFGIRANCVCPGMVDTPIHSFHSLPTDKKNEALVRLNQMQPLGRVGTPEEIAQSIYFLASDESPWTTGAILSVDGGIQIK